ETSRRRTGRGGVLRLGSEGANLRKNVSRETSVPENRNTRICRTTLWIKKSALLFKEMSLTTFGTFRAAGGDFERRTRGNGRIVAGSAITPIVARHERICRP